MTCRLCSASEQSRVEAGWGGDAIATGDHDPRARHSRLQSAVHDDWNAAKATVSYLRHALLLLLVQRDALLVQLPPVEGWPCKGSSREPQCAL